MRRGRWSTNHIGTRELGSFFLDNAEVTRVLTQSSAALKMVFISALQA